MSYLILVINFGSTSTKISVFENTAERLKVSVKHLPEELALYRTVGEQKEFREETVVRTLKEQGFQLEQFQAIASRGGNCRPVPGGIYRINEAMLEDIKSGRYGIHATGVGCEVAFELGKKFRIPALTADLPIADEFCELARFSGKKELPRISSGHVLNQKRTARIVAQMRGTSYEKSNMIVVHLGGGVSVGAHRRGKLIDMNNALDGEGPFSPERTGTIVVEEVIHLCFSGEYTEEEASRYFKGQGGLTSYLGTNNGEEIEKRIVSGDAYAKMVFQAMAYQVSKEIGGMYTVLEGKVDAIALTGGLAHSKCLTEEIKKRTGCLAPVYLVPGENEMVALAESSLRYLTGAEKAREYEEVITC